MLLFVEKIVSKLLINRHFLFPFDILKSILKVLKIKESFMMNIQFPSKIIKWGNSAGFRLRKEFMQSVGLSIGDHVIVSVRDSDNAIVIKKIEGDK